MSNRIMWAELFPTRFSFIIFVAYTLLFVNQGILVTASQDSNNNYVYNTVTVVLLTEVLKLVLSTLLYCKDHSFKSLIVESIQHSKVFGLYFVPAFLYCIYNNLTFENLSSFDPTTYNLLLQFRVVLTGILFQVIFKKTLSQKQWISLIILTFGCMLRAVDFDKIWTPLEGTTKSKSVLISSTDEIKGLVLILIQMLCSCFAGVYNEYILKNSGVDVNIFVQNVFMYVDSIICNVIVLLLQGNLSSTFTMSSLSTILQYKIILIMINSASVGIITSLFLKSLNSILKTFASALELAIIAVVSYLLLGLSIHLNTILAICVVSYSIFLYSRAPVVNTVKKVHDDEKELLADTV